MTDDALLTSLLAAVSAAPDDVPLRLHVAELLAAAQRNVVRSGGHRREQAGEQGVI